MEKRRFKRIISFSVSLLMMAGMFGVLAPSVNAIEKTTWNIDDLRFIGGVFTVKVSSAQSGEMSLTVDGERVEGEDVTEIDGCYFRNFQLDTTAYADGNKRIAFFLNGEKIEEKVIYFDNTAPVIDSWTEFEPNTGKKYTAYDMTVWPDDIIILNGGKSFEIDFYPNDGEGSGVATVTAKLDEVDIPVPFTVEYDYLSAGFHNISYTLTDKVGNSTTVKYKFEFRKPEPSYSDIKVIKNSEGYRISAKLTGSFTRYTADFYLAEILEATGYENVTFGDISADVNEGEKCFGGRINGGFFTEAYSGGEVYQIFDIDVSSKAGNVFVDYSGEIPKGSKGELSIYDYSESEWKVVNLKTCYTGRIDLNIGKKGVLISDYAKNGIIKVRVRVISDSDAKYINTLSFVPSIRFNSKIGDTQTGTKGTVAAVVYTGNANSNLGWYIRGEADYFYSYSPTCGFEIEQEKILQEQFNTVFSGDVYTRVAITWQTEEKTGSRVQIRPYGGICPDFTTAVTYTGTVNYNEVTGKYAHKVRISGLTPGAKYWIRYGDSSLGIWSEPRILAMPEEGNEFSFAAASPSSGEGAQENLNTLLWRADAEFMMTSGGEAADESGWREYFSEFEGFFNRIRIVPAVGKSANDIWWTKYYLPEQSGAGHTNGVYYSFKYKNSIVAVLNSNDLNAKGELNTAQLRWLKKVLSDGDADWKFVLLDAKLTGDAGNTALLEQLSSVFEENSVDIVFTSGGYERTGELGNETVALGENEYFSNSGVLYVSLPSIDKGYVDVFVSGKYLEFSCGVDTVKLFSASRLEWISKRIEALPSSENLTIKYLDEIRAIRSIYDEEDAELREKYVKNEVLLAMAEARMEELIKLTPPEINVQWKQLDKLIPGSLIMLPEGTASDLTDGDTEVTVRITDPDGEVIIMEENGFIAEKCGIYTVVYSSIDSDGNETSKEFTFLVKEYALCDTDFDGILTVADALKALRFAAKILTPDEVDIAIADTDGDGEITVSDSLYILGKVIKR